VHRRGRLASQSERLIDACRADHASATQARRAKRYKDRLRGKYWLRRLK